MKIALGTVQFGLLYGIANDNGQVSEREAKRILEYAKEFSIDTLDTAIAYGSSEQCLGDIGVENWDIVTKLSAIPKDCKKVGAWIEGQLLESLKRLNVRNVKGFMLHNPMQLLEQHGEEIWSTMVNMKDRGFVNKIGLSVYSPQELDQILNFIQPDIIQIPLNILDQRFLEKNYINRLKESGIEIHARSAFLQGLLLLPLSNIPPWFNPILGKLEEFNMAANRLNISTLQLALGFVQSIDSVDKVVVGVDTLKQLQEIIAAENIRVDTKEFLPLSIIDESFVNPANWMVDS